MATTISGSTGVTYPNGGLDNTTGAGVGTTDTQTLTNKTIQGGATNSGTNVPSTSGTSIEFTSIPSWVKRITVMFNGVSVSATADIIIQLGTGATPTYTITGYLGSASTQTGTAENFTTGYKVVNSNAAASVWHGNIVIDNVTGNTWAQSAVLGNSNAGGVRTSGGSIPLAAALTAVRITTNSTDTFDLGSINILYE